MGFSKTSELFLLKFTKRFNSSNFIVLLVDVLIMNEIQLRII